MTALPEELASRLQTMTDKLELLADSDAIALANFYLRFQQSEQLDELKDQVQALRNDIEQAGDNVTQAIASLGNYP